MQGPQVRKWLSEFQEQRKAIWLEDKVSTGVGYRSEMGEVGRVRIQGGHVGCCNFSLAVV